MRRLTWGLVPLFLVLGTGHASAFSPADTAAALESVGPIYGFAVEQHARSIVWCETGGTLSPSAIGDHGSSFGAAQLHHGGLLEHFRSVGYSDPFNPYEAIDYLARAIVGEWSYLRIGAWSWTCA